MTAITLILLSVASYVDVRDRKIPNWLTAPGCAVGILLNLWLGNGWLGLQGMLAGLAVFILPYMLGKVSGGDLKLWAAVGALLGPVPLMTATLFVLAVSALLLAIDLSRTLGIKGWLQDWIMSFAYGNSYVSPRVLVVPGAVIMLAGTLFYFTARIFV